MNTCYIAITRLSFGLWSAAEVVWTIDCIRHYTCLRNEAEDDPSFFGRSVKCWFSGALWGFYSIFLLWLCLMIIAWTIGGVL